jgi:pyruvate dehydrogenase E2 component (dihydrolipoyllysine-residue acetyltransferase)
VAKEKIVVPDIGGAEGAEVIELLVAVGDEVALEQSLIVLESDKASMEIPSSMAGTVVELLTDIGKELSEGDGIVVLEVAGAADAGGVEETATAAPAQPESAPEPEPEPIAATATVETNPPAATASVEQLVPVPDIGTDEAVELIEVCVAVGDTVAEGDSLVVLESDKASMEVPAPFAGEVLAIRVSEGGTVRQGDELLLLRSSGAVSTAAPEVAQAEAPAAPVSKSAAAAPPVAPARPQPSTPATTDDGPLYVGPAVRKLAREFGLDLTKISGSGPRGRIVKEDLQEHVKNSLSAGGAASAGSAIPPIPEVDHAAFGAVEFEALSKMSKVTAANMQRSWLNVPHVTQFDDADITDLESFRADMKAEAEKRGVKLTPMPFLLKACAVALRDHPKFRSALVGDGETLVNKQYTHIGMAVDTPAGLLVPVIRDVDKKSIWELAEEIVAVAGKARDRKLRPVDMQGGCFTISSLGNIGGTGFTPIVNAPEVAILGVSRASIQPVWDGAVFQPRKMLPLSLSYDHRVINGGDGGRFFTDVVALLGDIRRMTL